MKNLKKYLQEELGIINIDDVEKYIPEIEPQLKQFEKELESKDYRLLFDDNFYDCYGKNSGLIIKIITAEHWFDIIVYKNIYKGLIQQLRIAK